MDDETYKNLCSLSTHITPDTIPNMHSEDNRPRVGGFNQPEGLRTAMSLLHQTLLCVTLGLCKFLGDESAFEQLVRLEGIQGGD